MRRPLFKLVAVCLLLLALVTPRPGDRTPPPIISPSVTSEADWSVLRTKLDEQAYRLAVFYAEASKPAKKATALRSAGSGNHRGYATAKECVSMVEHSGSYDRSSNPGHTGRYQFSRPTWIAFGGNPDTWENASPEEQDAVFERAWNSPGGPSNWLPYDGCG